MILYLVCFGVGLYAGVILMAIFHIGGSIDDIKEIAYLRRRIAALEAIQANSGISWDEA